MSSTQTAIKPSEIEAKSHIIEIKAEILANLISTFKAQINYKICASFTNNQMPTYFYLNKLNIFFDKYEKLLTRVTNQVESEFERFEHIFNRMNREETYSNGRSSQRSSHDTRYRRNTRWNGHPCYADLNNRQASNQRHYNNHSPQVGSSSTSTYNSNNYNQMDELVADEGFLNNQQASPCSSLRSTKLESMQLRIDCGTSKHNSSDRVDKKDVTITNQTEKDPNFASTPTFTKDLEKNLLSVSNLSKIFPSPESDLNRNNLLGSLSKVKQQEQDDVNKSKLNQTSSNEKKQTKNQDMMSKDQLGKEQELKSIELTELNKSALNKNKYDLRINSKNENQSSSKELSPSDGKFPPQQQQQQKKACNLSASSPNQDIQASYEEQQEKVFKVNSFLEENVKYDVYVTHVETPTLFWIQLKDLNNEQTQFEKKLNQFYNDPVKAQKYKLKQFNVNVLCAAKFSLDYNWYRARILRVNMPDRTVLVHYYDYGNCESVEFENVCTLDEQFAEKSVFSFPLSLANAHPVIESNQIGQWSQVQINSFKDLVLNRSASITVRCQSSWPIFFCDLSIKLPNESENVDVLDYMVKKNLASKRSYDFVFASFEKKIEEDNDFYLLRKTSGMNHNFDRNPSPSEESVPNNRFFSPNPTDNPCSPAGANDNEVVENFDKDNCNEDKESESPSSSFQSIDKQLLANSREAYSKCDPKSIQNNDLIYTLDDLPKKYLNLDTDSKFLFDICYIKNPFEFYIYLMDDRHEKYKDLEFKINQFYFTNQHFLKNISKQVSHSFAQPETLCIAYNQLHRKFYRALIKQIRSNNQEAGMSEFNSTHLVQMFYIDHGETVYSSINDLYPMQIEFCSLPPYCVNCKLDLVKPIDSPVTNEWSKEAIMAFKNLMYLKSVYRATVRNQVAMSSVECKMNRPLELIIFSDHLNQQIINKELVRIGYALFTFNGLNNASNTINDQLDNQDEMENFDDDHFESASHRNLRLHSSKILQSNRLSKFDDSRLTHLTCKGEKIKLPEYDENFKMYRIHKYVEHQATLAKSFNDQEINSNIINSEMPLDYVKNKEQNVLNKETVNKCEEKKSTEHPTQVLSPIKVTPTTNPTIEKLNESKKYVEIPEMERFNPLRKEFESIRNNYGYNEKNFDSVLFGYEYKYDSDICHNMLKYGQCSRPRCPFIHQIPKPEPVPTTNNIEKTQAYFKGAEGKRFQKNDYILLKMISIQNNNLFKGTLLGYFDKNLNCFIDNNYLLDLHKRMNKYYGNYKFLSEKTPLFLIDQLVAAKSKQRNCWLRARVIEILTNQSIDNTKIKVFYCDLGSKEILNIKDVYPIKQTFLNTPFQSCLFKLNDCNVEQNDKEKMLNYLKELNTKTRFLKAKVISVDTNGLFTLDIHAKLDNTNDSLFVNEYLRDLNN